MGLVNWALVMIVALVLSVVLGYVVWTMILAMVFLLISVTTTRWMKRGSMDVKSKSIEGPVLL